MVSILLVICVIFHPGCQEVYSDDKQQYACLTGCKAPTWDTAFPDRGHLYKDPTTPEGGDMGSIMAQMWVALMAQSDVFTPREFDELQDHAMDMELVIIPYRQFDITILADDVSTNTPCTARIVCS